MLVHLRLCHISNSVTNVNCPYLGIARTRVPVHRPFHKETLGSDPITIQCLDRPEHALQEVQHRQAWCLQGMLA